MLRRLGPEGRRGHRSPWVNKALEKAQQKVEARNYDIRKNLLKYDDVMNDQRKVVFEQRKDMMRAENVHDTVLSMRTEVLEDLVARCIPPRPTSSSGTLMASTRKPGASSAWICRSGWAKEDGIADEEILERLREAVDAKMATKDESFTPDIMRAAEKQILLAVLDKQWKEHLLALDHLRHGIGLRAYGQRDPLNEYKREAFGMFEAMLNHVREEVTMLLSHVQIRGPQPDAIQRPPQEMHETRQDPARADAEPEPALAGAETAARAAPRPTLSRSPDAEFDPNDPSTWGRTGRNAPCPCGSGKKYKHCHGSLV